MLFNTLTKKFEYPRRQFNSVLSGSGAPSESIGQDKDFYIDTENLVIYQKSSSGWDDGISLRGKDGESIKGDPGKSGDNGQPGRPGKDGVGIASIIQNGAELVIDYTDGRTDKLTLPEQKIEIPPPAIGIASVEEKDGNMVIVRTNGDKTVIKLPKGKDAREIEFGRSRTHVQWRYKGGEWHDLFAIPRSTSGGGAHKLTHLGDIDFSTQQDNYALTYDAASDSYDFSPSGGGSWGSITGDLPDQTDLQAALDAKAASSHTHSASDITSGTFADARIAESNVTQHQAALSVTASQVSDFDTEVSNNTDVAASKAITDNITVTQAVDLDTIETRVNALDAAVVLQGSWDASAGSFPGVGTAQAGDSYIVSTGGTVDSVVFTANDRIVAITDNASTSTYSANWLKLDYTDQVLSVNTQTGAVVLDADDIDDGSTANKFVTASDLTNLGNLSGTNTGDQVSGDFNHSGLQDLAWTSSGHTGTASSLAAFSGAGAAAEIDYSTDWLSQYALLAGRSGGQTVIGGTGSGENIELIPNSAAANGLIILGSSDASLNVSNNQLSITGDAAGIVNVTRVANQTVGYFATGYGNTAGLGPTNQFRRGRGTESATSALNNGDVLGSFRFSGSDGVLNGSSSFTAISGQLAFRATENFSATNQGTSFEVALAPNGSTSRAIALYADGSGNVGVASSSFGTNAAGVLGIANGTAPTTSPANIFQMYSSDIVAGNAAPHFRTEGGEIIRLYQQALISDPTGGSTIDSEARSAINDILDILENNGLMSAT